MLIKNSLKTATFTLTLLFFTLVPLQNNKTYAQTISPSQEHIKKFDIQINVLTSGKIEVEEHINYFFPAQRHGIYRKIPLTKTNQDNQKYRMQIEDILVVNENGNPYNFSTSGINSIEPQIKIGDANKWVEGEVEYIIKYTISGAISYFSDHDELYWNAIGTGWEIPIQTATVRINLPSTVSETQVRATCYIGTEGSSETNCSTRFLPEKSQFEFTSARPLLPSQAFTTVVSFPKNVVSVLEPIQQKEFQAMSPLTKFILITLFVLGVGLWYLALPGILAYLSYKRNAEFRDKVKIVSAWFDPPKNRNGQALTPAETRLVYDGKVDNNSVTATIIHLAQKGFLKIRIHDKKDITFEIGQNPLDQKLKKYEEDLLKGIFQDHSNSDLGDVLNAIFSFGSSNKKEGNNQFVVNIKDIKKSKEFGHVIIDFLSTVKKKDVTENYFKTSLSKYNNMFSVLLSFSIITANIPLLISSIVYFKKYLPFTDLGYEVYSKSASLRNFLVSQDEQLDFQAQNQMFFEKLLPYATAFGVEDVWIKRFKDILVLPQQSDWYEGNMTNALVWSTVTNSLNSTMKSASSTYISSTRSSSGFSSGFSGGSSGGGGGGGGGGSW